MGQNGNTTQPLEEKEKGESKGSQQQHPPKTNQAQPNRLSNFSLLQAPGQQMGASRPKFAFAMPTWQANELFKRN